MPNTMKPIDLVERAKMAELQHDNQNNSQRGKVEWLYSGNKVDTNSYLLGKPIDKLLTESQNEAQSANQLAYSNTIDLASKIREDPLFEIKRQEIEAKKRLLENPIRLKQLKEMISKSYQNGNPDDEDKKRNHKKSKKNTRSRSRSLTKRQKHDRNRSSSNTRRQKYARNRSKSPKPTKTNEYYGYSRQHRSKSPKREKELEKSKDKIEEITRVKKKIEDLKRIRDYRTGSSAGTRTTEKQQKITDEERQRKLDEMSSNAKWRNELRDKNIKKHEQFEKSENEKESRAYGHTDVFNNMMRDAYVSAEDRIKRNIKNIQRNTSDYDEKNFARK